MHKTLAALALALTTVSSAAAQQAPGAPLGVDRSACRPSFTVGGQTYQAGTAFLVEGGGRTYLVTAHHLFGQGGGLPADIAWQDLPTKIAGLRCQPFAGRRIWTTGAPLAIPGAAPGENEETLNDIAAFPIQIDPPMRGFVLKLAAQPPKPRDTVWLLASLMGGAPASQMLHRATVAKVSANGGLIFLYDNPNLEIRATSGAAILNAEGQVVGVNFGGGPKNGRVYGFATGLPALRAAIVRPKP
jgi:hypothetical protein